MVVDIVSDLELDVDPGTDSMDVPPTSERLDEIRVYLASYYLASSYVTRLAVVVLPQEKLTCILL